METLVKLLERRALCLRNMVEISLKCLNELHAHGDLGLQDFHVQRKSLFEVIKSLDNQIEPLMKGAETSVIAPLLDVQAGWLTQLKTVDGDLYKEINRIKTEVIYNLQQLSSGKRAISAYKTPKSLIDSDGTGTVNKEA